MPLLSILPLLGISTALQRQLNVGAAMALMLSVSGWLALAFIGGLVGLLWWTSALIWLVGAILLVVQLPSLLAVWQRQPPVVYALLVLFCLGFWFVHHDSQYFYFDEYGHWGIFIKDMWVLDGFWQADSNALHLRYPPGSPLWQYTFGIFAAPVDSSAYFAQFVLLITPLMVLFDRLQWRQAGWIAAITIACIIGLANFGHGVASLYVDHLVSTWLFGVLLVFMLERKPSMGFTLALALPLIVLSLLKDAGFAFTLSATSIIAAVFVVRRLKRRPEKRLAALGSGLLVAAVLLAPSATALKTWSMNRDANGVATETMSLGGIARGVLNGERALSDEGSALITQRFADVFMQQQISKDATSAQFNAFSVPLMPLFEDDLRLTTFSAYAVFALFFALLIAFGRLGDDTLPWLLLALGLLGAALAYSATLYFSYLFAFGERGPILSSYVRYTHSIVLTLFLMIIAALSPASGLISHRVRLSRRQVPTSGALLALLLAWMFVFETPHLNNIYRSNPVLPQRASADDALGKISAALDNSRLWVFFPADRPNGFLGRLLQFQLAPTPTVVERSAAFLDGDAAAIRQTLSNYDVLWFPIQNDELDRRVRDLLGIELSERFVLAVTDGDGRTRFEPVKF